MPLRVETCVATHIGDRTEQQDRVDVFGHPERPGMLMAVLADGMGGHSGGGIAAEQVIVKARQNLANYVPQSESLGDCLEEIIQDAHVAVSLTGFTSEKDPHTTALIFLLHAGQAAWAHCGDSRLYHLRGTQAVSRTEDHSLIVDLVRHGRITAEEAKKHPQRNVLMSCLGGTEPPRVARGGVDRLTAGDAFLLCSDGLWAYFSDGELATLIARQSARQAAEELVALARERAKGRGDNISLALVKLVEA